MPFRYFVVSSFRLAIWRGEKTKNALRKDEITKKSHAKKQQRNNARRKDEITKSVMRKDHKHARNNEMAQNSHHRLKICSTFVLTSLTLYLIEAPLQTEQTQIRQLL